MAKQPAVTRIQQMEKREKNMTQSNSVIVSPKSPQFIKASPNLDAVVVAKSGNV